MILKNEESLLPTTKTTFQTIIRPLRRGGAELSDNKQFTEYSRFLQQIVFPYFHNKIA